MKKNNYPVSIPQALDIVIDDERVSISRNYNESLAIPIANKNLIALLDAILNPEKYNIQVHDVRTRNVWSKLSYEKEAKKIV